MDDDQIDIEKIDALNREAWDIRVSDSLSSGRISEKAILLSRRVNYSKGLADSLRTRAFFLISQSKHIEALMMIEDAMPIYQSAGDENGLSDLYEYSGIISRFHGNLKESFEFLYKSYAIRKKTGYEEGESLALYQLGLTNHYLGNLEKALEQLLLSIEIGKNYNGQLADLHSLNIIGNIYHELDDSENALSYYNKNLVLSESLGDRRAVGRCLDNIGYIQFQRKEYEQANHILRKAISIAETEGDRNGEANAVLHLGEIAWQTGKAKEARELIMKCIEIRNEQNDKKGQCEAILLLARNSIKKEQAELLNTGWNIAMESGSTELQCKIHFAFYEFLKTGKQFDKALEQHALYHQKEKDILSTTHAKRISNLHISLQAEISHLNAELHHFKNIELVKVNEENQQQHAEFSKILKELINTRQQLIEKEKMAALGDLSVGIALELQNLLNFVNTFSLQNHELVDELKKEINSGNHAVARHIATEIQRNLEIININSKRADAIVKNILLQSQGNNSEKQLADINLMVNEYLRLAYLGSKARDKAFNVILKTNFDTEIGKIPIIPHDIGQVLLNLYYAGFNALTEKQKIASELYTPTLSVRTKNLDGRIEIMVKDNGLGIPPELLDKIFQPGIITLPSGQETGLGLSLSYDIITKGHRGTLTVESSEEEGSEFIIGLPVFE